VRIPNEAADGFATVTLSYKTGKGKDIPPGTIHFNVR
jgi:hypothetical protein